MDTPLIFTTKGNVPVDSLEYKNFWLETEDATTFVEEYRRDGELVKRNVHSRLKRGLDAGIEQQLFGG